eukprot:m.625880 g.625880  ORF g.625880 m.625880 type:complete len:99 (-) comp58236_c1_seq81:372-668(-)
MNTQELFASPQASVVDGFVKLFDICLFHNDLLLQIGRHYPSRTHGHLEAVGTRIADDAAVLGRTREVSWSNKVTQGTDQAYRCLLNSRARVSEEVHEH